jgi:hypothetical protein
MAVRSGNQADQNQDVSKVCSLDDFDGIGGFFGGAFVRSDSANGLRH